MVKHSRRELCDFDHVPLPPMKRVRLDTLLSERGMFPSRSRAAASVLAGDVLLLPGRRRADKPGQLVSEDVQKTVALDALGIPVLDKLVNDAEGSAAPNTPAGVLKGAEVWVPDWNAVLAELDTDIAAYQKATGS